MPSKIHRTALVTGASRVIGAALCRRLAGAGLKVWAVARSASPLAALAEECPGLTPIVADVRDTDRIWAALGDVELDVLVNNAGMVSSVKPLEQQTAAEIAETIAVDLTAPLLLMHRALPPMIARRRGHVVNITSTAGHHVFAGTTAYAAAKAGLSRACDVARFDLVGSNVRITEIAPGRVETDIYLGAFGEDRERLRDALYARVRSLRPDDVAEAVIGVLATPDRVDVARLEITPTDQAPGGHRTAETTDAD